MLRASPAFALLLPPLCVCYAVLGQRYRTVARELSAPRRPPPRATLEPRRDGRGPHDDPRVRRRRARRALVPRAVRRRDRRAPTARADRWFALRLRLLGAGCVLSAVLLALRGRQAASSARRSRGCS